MSDLINKLKIKVGVLKGKGVVADLAFSFFIFYLIESSNLREALDRMCAHSRQEMQLSAFQSNGRELCIVYGHFKQLVSITGRVSYICLFWILVWRAVFVSGLKVSRLRGGVG